MRGTVAAVVVDYDAGAVLGDCVRSLGAQELEHVVVVENGDPARARATLAASGAVAPLLPCGRNLGYGAGANRGLAATGFTDYVLICNPDLWIHPGAVDALAAVLDAEPSWAIVGPRLLTPEGATYPSVRRFPSMVDAAGYALCSVFWPENSFARRYRPAVPAGESPCPADWVSGACLLVRRQALEELGGFDESYFMFAEEMDLCWRAHQAGWGVGFHPAAVVTHVEGVSRRQHPYRMLAWHHRSALKFAANTTAGWRRAALPLAAVVLGVRLVAAWANEALSR